MKRKFKIVLGHCCGHACAKIIRIKRTGKEVQLQWAPASSATISEWRHNEDPDKDAHLEWAMKLSSIQMGVDRAVEEKQITQEENERIVAEWVNENPDPAAPTELVSVAGIPFKVEQPTA